MSRGKLSFLPISGILWRISAPSIGELFQAYPTIIPVGTKILVVPRSSAAIVTVYLKSDRNSQQRAPYGSV